MDKKEIRKAMIDRLCRSAKGYKQVVDLKTNITERDKQAVYEVIKEITDYLDNYEENTKWKELYTDDGR